MSDPRSAYKASGVDVDAGDALVERIKPMAASTRRAGADGSLGGFGAVFDLQAAGHTGSLLVASTDGVGTKLRLAAELGRLEGVGIDLVAMCVNDILTQGAEPLFFLDYYAAGRLTVDEAATVVDGIAAGCRTAGCALIGGETAEMPGHYAPGDFDLAGFVVGAVARENLLPQPTIGAGDVLVALPSSGVHSNGFSLIRRIGAERGWDYGAPFEGRTLGEALLEPTRIYAKSVLAALTAHGPAIRGMAHITGGGITGNLPRILPGALAARILRSALPSHPILAFIQDEGGLTNDEMAATFNAGAGLILAVEQGHEGVVMETLDAAGEAPAIVGQLVARRDGHAVVYRP